MKFLTQIPFLRYAYLYKKNCFHRPAHYYSPVVDLEDLKSRQDKIWCDKELVGIDLNDRKQKRFFHYLEVAEKLMPFTHDKNNKHRYYYNNPSYTYADAVVLFAMLNLYQPRNIIEVGSGYSSALMLDTIEYFLNTYPEVTFIEPNPATLHSILKDSDYETTGHIRSIVQQLPKHFFNLQPNDILFIDSSHVSKTGSDVNYLLTEILPSLNRGVIVHIHDIFYPFEYPKEWVLDKKLNWSELYAVHNFLLFNKGFEILFFSDYIQQKYPNLKNTLFFKSRPGSLWLKKL